MGRLYVVEEVGVQECGVWDIIGYMVYVFGRMGVENGFGVEQEVVIRSGWGCVYVEKEKGWGLGWEGGELLVVEG